MKKKKNRSGAEIGEKMKKSAASSAVRPQDAPEKDDFRELSQEEIEALSPEEKARYYQELEYYRAIHTLYGPPAYRRDSGILMFFKKIGKIILAFFGAVASLVLGFVNMCIECISCD